jgi:general secretion pathway protein A
MYESFYKLKEKPFQIVPNPDYLYLSPKHQSALTHLEYGLMEDVGVILLTGEIGMGKTTLTRRILDQYCRDMQVSVVFNTNVSPAELMSLVLKGYDLPSNNGGKSDLIDRLYRFLIEKYAAREKTLLIIDEAQNLSDEALEEVRMLSNLQSDEHILLQILLVGQPELKRRLSQPHLLQLAQRIAVNFHLSALSREETHQYIAHRLHKAGRDKTLFTTDAVDLIYDAAGGIPRSINLICDFALVYAFGEEMDPVDTAVIEKVVSEKNGLGLCPSYAEPLIELTDPLPGDPPMGGRSVESRIAGLEALVRHMRRQCGACTQRLEQNSGDSRDALMKWLKNRLSMERQKRQRLNLHCRRLLAEVKRLRGCPDDSDHNSNPQDFQI